MQIKRAGWIREGIMMCVGTNTQRAGMENERGWKGGIMMCKLEGRMEREGIMMCK